MQPLTKLLKRWQALDRALISVEGMYLKDFARKHRVTTRTVLRDIDVFRSVGLRVISHPEDVREHVWEYEEGAPGLFNPLAP